MESTIHCTELLDFGAEKRAKRMNYESITAF
jgi:hypothetical protein